MNKETITKYLPYAVVLIVLYYAIYNLFVGEKKKGNKELRKLNSNKVFSDSFFDSMRAKYGKYYKPNYIGYLVSCADRIYNAKGTFMDNDGSALRVFSGIQSKAELSAVNRVMKKLKGEDIPAYISFMDSDNIRGVNAIIAGLPEFVEPSKDKLTYKLPEPSILDKLKSLF